MVLNNNEIRTPFNYSDSYDADWRWQLAQSSMGSARNIRKVLLLDDEDINTAIAILTATTGPLLIRDTLRDMCSIPYYNEDPRVVLEKARRIQNDFIAETSSTAGYLQALLLCADMTLTEICHRLSLSKDVVLAYERVFFNCRDDDWKPLSIGIRRHLALDGQPELGPVARPNVYWRYTGVINGYRLLYNEWGWSLEEGVPTAAIAKALQRSTLNNARRTCESGLVPKQAQASIIEVIHRMLEDHAEGELDSDQQLILDKLTELAPTMREIEDEDLEALAPELQKKLLAMQEAADNEGEKAGEVKDDILRSQLEGK